MPAAENKINIDIWSDRFGKNRWSGMGRFLQIIKKSIFK